MCGFNLKSVVAAVAVLTSVGVASADDWKLGVRISNAQGGGAYIHEVFTGSPAELAGLMPGHTILALDGNLFNTALDMRNYVMSGDAPSINLIYSDGFGFYQVTADFQIITMMAMEPVTTFGGKTQYKKVERQMLKLKAKPKRIKVSDPRKTK